MALTQVPIELSSTPGIVDNSNATAITIDSSENVGIGTSSPAKLLDVAGAIRAINSAGSSAAEIDITSGGTWRFRSNPTTGTNSYGLDIVKGSAGTDVKMSIDSSGNVELKGGQELRVYRGDNATYGSIKYLTGSGGLQLNDKNGDGISFVKADGATEYGRFDASGNLLVGKTSSSVSSSGLTVIANDFMSYTNTSTDSGDRCLILNRQNGSGNILDFQQANGLVGSIGTVTQSGATNLVLDSTSAVYFDTNARPKTDNTYDVGSGTYRFKDLYLSGGAYLGGTAAANKLDDYEEGTFTPSFQNGSFTYASVTSGTYVKVGDLVVVNINIGWSAKSGSGNLAIVGLPFTALNLSGMRYTGALGYTFGLDFGGREFPTVTGSGNTTVMNFYANTDNATPVSIQVSGCSSSGEIQVTTSYRTT